MRIFNDNVIGKKKSKNIRTKSKSSSQDTSFFFFNMLKYLIFYEMNR